MCVVVLRASLIIVWFVHCVMHCTSASDHVQAIVAISDFAQTARFLSLPTVMR
jgi:hypothetical protein